MTQTISPFAVGQVWAYHTRPSEPDSRMTIIQIDQDTKLGSIVHIRVTGLRLKTSQVETGVSNEITHLPFSLQALSASVTVKVGDGGSLGHFQEGYDLWKQAFDTGEGGIWTLSLAETVEAMEHSLNH